VLTYPARIARLAWRDPQEFMDRLRGQLEAKLDRGPFEIPDVTERSWVEDLHHLLGVPYPCDRCAGFEALWAEASEELARSGHELGEWYDAGRRLAESAYAAVRHLEPSAVVETGVARGVTTRFLLQAMDGHGELYSVDLPPNRPGWENDSASAVPLHLRGHWHFARGASKRLLPGIVERHAPLRLFIHDSLHTTKNVLFELRTVWPHLAPGGVILVDDVDQNSAFATFAREVDCRWAVAREAGGTGMVGALVKTI